MSFHRRLKLPGQPPKGMGPEMLCKRSQCSDRQEKQCPDDEDRPEQEDAKGDGVSAQSPQTKRARFLRSEICRHGYRRNNRKIAAEEHHQACRDIPWDGLGAGFGLFAKP